MSRFDMSEILKVNIDIRTETATIEVIKIDLPVTRISSATMSFMNNKVREGTFKAPLNFVD